MLPTVLPQKSVNRRRHQLRRADPPSLSAACAG
jgi:hypothetical protein